jgi:hypothetical protein
MLYKSITATTQVATTECFLDGIEFSYTDNAELKVYDEAVGAGTAAKLVCTVYATGYTRSVPIIFPRPGIKLSGIYVVWTVGTGTIFYHY